MTCDNCRAAEAELVPVHRAYLVPEPRVLDEVERWCASCVTQYPHQPA